MESGAPLRGWTQVIAALVLGLALVVATIIGMNAVRYVKTFNTSLLKVNGEAQMDVTSDEVTWTGSYFVNAQNSALKQAYAQMSTDRSAVQAFLKRNGVKAADITVQPVKIQQNFVNCKINPKACGLYGATTSKLVQVVRVSSANVQKITGLAQDTTPLIQQGVVFSTQSLQYFYTKLPQVRAKLLAEATKEAQQRAGRIAKATGTRIGQLVSVNTEPLQLTPLHSNRVSNGGAYDTTTIQKKLTAIVQATFRLPQ